MITDISIRGYLVGPIWWPAGAECYKPLTYSVTNQDARFTEPGTLRDHVLHATMDGDFQGCAIGLGELVVRTERVTDSRRTIKERFFPLSMFPSIADCLNSDWCGPSGDDE